MVKEIKKTNVSSKVSAKKTNIITVKNADGDPDTTATILIQNKINYTPKVSVIIPVYNVEKYLRESLDSVINQTLKEIEIICVDDGSTDKSLEILKEYAKKDNRITVITQKNLHAGVARNAGLAVAKGEYLSFLDADDFFELNMLEETYNNAIKNDSDIVVYKYKQYDTINNQVGDLRGTYIHFNKDVESFLTNDLKDNLFTTCNPMPWNKLFKHKVIKQNGLFFQNLAASNDVYFSMSAMAVSERITYLNTSFVCYRHNRQGSLKNSRDKYPLNFYTAYTQLFNTLKEKQIFNKYAKTFINSFVSSAVWTFDNTQEKRSLVKDFIKNTIYPKYIKNNEELLSDSLKKRLDRVISNEIIVSLTSYPARIGTVNQTIESLLNQTMKADKVILWLAPEQFPNREKDLPKQLLDLKDKGLTIDWYHDIKSYKKIIPTIKKYPDAVIVTADDDLIFAQNWLETLYKGYKKHPNDINIHRATKFYHDRYGWHVIPGGLAFYKDGSILNKICSGAGAIFPQNCFYKDVLNEDLIKQLAPTNDDQWVWIQSVLNGKKIYVVDNNQPLLTYVPGTQETGLTRINDNGQKLFWKDFNRLMEYYPQVENILLKEAKKHRINKKFIVPYRKELEAWYNKIRGPINLDNPKTFNEKIQWLKLYDSTPIKTKLADKYLVRDWVAEKIGDKYLIPLLGVYNSFDEIDFDKLPNQFVIKTNHGSNWLEVVTDKSKINIPELKQKFDKWMATNFAFVWGIELHYRDIPPKIIIEKFVSNDGKALWDYKFWCFGGKVKYMQFRDDFSPNLKMVFYDLDWNKQPFYYDHPLYENDLEKPDNFDEMVKIAQKLCQGFAFVCVDLYRLNNGEIKFGEMTFTRSSGSGRWNKEKYNRMLGDLIELPKLAYNVDTGAYYKVPKVRRFYIRNFINFKPIKPYVLFPYYGVANMWMKNITIPLVKFKKHVHKVWYSHSARGRMDVLNANFNRITQLVQSVKTDMQQQIENVKTDMQQQIENVKTDMQQQIENVKTDMQQQIENVKTDMQQQVQTLEKNTFEALDTNKKELKENIEKDRILYFNPFSTHVNTERGMTDITSLPDFENRFKKLIHGLSSNDTATIVKIIRRLQLIKGTNSKLDLFTSQEKELLQRVREINREILKVSDNLYAYKNYLLPINHFEASVFFYNHGIERLNSVEQFKNKDILDIGGFIGDSILMLSPLTNKKIYSFEATKENFDLMKKTIELNKIKNAVPVHTAVGDKTGEIELRFNGSASSQDKMMVKEPQYVEKCQVIRIDDYVREHNIDVGLIKVDIEGAEQSFLRGARETITKYKPTLLISIYHNVDDFLDIKPMIESWNLGYKFKIFKPVIESVSGETLLICEQ